MTRDLFALLAVSTLLAFMHPLYAVFLMLVHIVFRGLFK